MPRIAATAVVLVLVAAAIGLNMARYPTVWQMVAPPSQSSQAEETLRPADTSHADRVAPAAASDNTSPPAGQSPRRPTMTLPVTTPRRVRRRLRQPIRNRRARRPSRSSNRWPNIAGSATPTGWRRRRGPTIGRGHAHEDAATGRPAAAGHHEQGVAGRTGRHLAAGGQSRAPEDARAGEDADAE